MRRFAVWSSVFALLVCLCAACSGARSGIESGIQTRGIQESPASSEPALDAEGVARFAEQAIESSDLIYVSDYFSFVGADRTGRMAFALDNNRGRDGDRYQAEHLVFLHDEQQGWVDVPGLSAYENPGHELRRIPDSPYFSFEGEPAQGLVIRSQQVPLTLTLSPLELKVVRAGPEQVFGMASAPATLQWNERVLEGRVIYEYLVTNHQNRLSRGFGFRQAFSPASFQGLYLLTADSSDLYMHTASFKGARESGFAELLGFQNENGDTAETEELDFRVTGRRQGPGLFRWPRSWMASWKSPRHGRSILQADAVEIRSVRSLIFGGYAMSIVKGTLVQDAKKTPVYGWGELIQWLY